MKYQQRMFINAAMGIFFLAVSLHSQASAQVVGITFSRTATNEFGLSEIDFGFNAAADVFVQFDQLGAADALFQNNDASGQDFQIEANGPIDSIGEVTIGQILNPGTNFGSTSLDVSTIISPGQDFFLGFSSGNDVGFFNIAWEPGANSDIVYSRGFAAFDGASLEVSAVPEPGSLTLVSALALAVFVRRRRG